MSDVRNGFVAPQGDVTRRVAEEIERRSSCRYSPITADFSAGGTETIPLARISADPSTFAESTIREIERVSAALSAARATTFDLRFDNEQTMENFRGEQIWVAARYLTRGLSHAMQRTSGQRTPKFPMTPISPAATRALIRSRYSRTLRAGAHVMAGSQLQSPAPRCVVSFTLVADHLQPGDRVEVPQSFF